MLRSKTLTAVSRVGLIPRKTFCLGAVSRGEVTPADAPIDLTSYTYNTIPQASKDRFYPHLGNRDIVGPSYSTTYDYDDAVDYPMPSVRWAANTPEVLALREKEAGDWTKLTLEEKKQLYRNSYRQTFAEMEAPTGDWKRISYIFLYITAAASVYFVYCCENYSIRPRTLTPEYQQEMVATMLMRNAGSISGLSSKYDFEKNEWKK